MALQSPILTDFQCGSLTNLMLRVKTQRICYCHSSHSIPLCIWGKRLPSVFGAGNRSNSIEPALFHSHTNVLIHVVKSSAITRANHLLMNSYTAIVLLCFRYLKRRSQLDVEQLEHLPRMLMQPPMHLDKGRASHYVSLK